MKKLSLVFVAVFTLFCGVFISACNFKSPRATFSEDVVMISQNEQINLDDYLSVRDIDKSEIEYRFSSSEFFSREGNTLTPTTYGQTMVYATYEGNSLDSFLFVVKKPLEQVANIVMDDTGLVTWNAVIDKFDETEDFVTASNYHLNIHFFNEDENVERDFEFSASTNSYQLTEYGRYTLEIVAEATGKFDASPVATSTVYFGYMPTLTYDDFDFVPSTNLLTWSLVSNANYTVTFNNGESKEVLATGLEEERMVLSSALSPLGAGDYTLTVTVHDDAGEKISKESDEIVIAKLSAPEVEGVFDEQNGGRVRLAMAENALKISAVVGDESFEFEDASNETTFDGVAPGEHSVMVQSMAVDSKRDGVFYANSNVVNGLEIYKLEPLTIVGRGENAENADEINVTISSVGIPTSTSFKTHLTKGEELYENLDTDGLEAGALSKDKEISLSGAGEYRLVGYNYAKSATFNDAYLVNSNASNEFNFTKLDAVSSLVHSYQEVEDRQVSTLTFTPVSGAEAYKLYVQNSGSYEEVGEGKCTISAGVITFSGKIEDIFEESYFTNNIISFKVSAEMLDGTSSVPSATTKGLTRLTTPTSMQRENAEVEYSWNAVAGADEYLVNYAIIDKATFEGGVDAVADVERTTTSQSETSITLAAGQYYYIEIFAVPEDENANLTSSPLREVICVSDMLDTPVVHFGFDEERVTSDMAEATGYFLDVENVENMASLSVTLDGQEVLYNYVDASDGVTTFFFTSEFASTSASNIQVVASAEDSTLYPNSTPYTLAVKRLNAGFNNGIIGHYEIDEFSSTFTLKHGMEGVTDISIRDLDTSSNFATGDAQTDAIFNIPSGNGRMEIALKGSAFDDETGYYSVVKAAGADIIYLESAPVEYAFQRATAPSNFDYYDGNITFTSSVGVGDYHVLDLRIVDSNNRNILMKFDISSTTARVAVYEENGRLKTLLEEKVTLEGASGLLTNSSTNYTLNYEALIDILREEEYADYFVYYSQASDISFSLYLYQNGFMGDTFLISSPYATTLLDGSQSLIVSKMATPELSYDKIGDYLYWTLDDSNNPTGSSYEVYGYNVETGERSIITTVQNTQYNVQKDGLTASLDYRYEVVATNPRYLESSASRVVTIHIIAPVDSVLVSENNLIVTPNSSDINYITSVNYAVGEEENTTSSRSDDSFILDSLSEGRYALTYEGTTTYETEGRYYLSSNSAIINLAPISDLAPSDTTINYSQNVVSFNGLTQNMASLKYLVSFTDGANTFVGETRMNEYAVTQENLSSLNAGNVTINVFAVLASYTVSVGESVVAYFNAEATQIGDYSYYNTYSYPENIVVTKLSTPEIENVEFVGEDADAITPQMRITVSGNYTSSDTFVVYFGSDRNSSQEFSAIGGQDGNFELLVGYDDYISYFSAGELNDVNISVTSRDNIPSSLATAKVYFNRPLASISQQSETFEISADESVSAYSKEITFNFQSAEDMNYAQGGITLEVTFTPISGQTQTTYLTVPTSNFVEDSTAVVYDLTDFIATNLSMGGRISYRAHVNSESDGTNFILASSAISSSEYEVLTAPSYTQGGQANTIKLTNEGIELTDINSGAGYLVSYMDGSNPATAYVGEDEDFFFEYPDTWVSGESYSVTIMAIADGKISSPLTDSSKLNIVLQRLGTVGEVSVTREASDLSNVTLSWDAVENADAYIVRAYILSNGVKTYVGSRVESDDTSVLVSEIFGENYQSLSSFVSAGRELYLEIIASDSTFVYQNSRVKLVNARLLGTMGNNLDAEDMDITENGELYFSATEGVTYLYSVASLTGDIYLPWTLVTAETDMVKIDLSSLSDTIPSIFVLRVMVAGDAREETIVYNDDTLVLNLDSQYIQGSKNFMQTANVADIAVNTTDSSKLSVTVNNEVVKVFASLNNTFNIDEAVFIEGIYDDFMPEHGQFTYNLNMSLLLDKFDITSDTNIYFYVVQESIENELYYVLSRPEAYLFRLMSASDVYEVRKVTEGDTADLMRTYIVYEERADYDITGFNIIIDYENPLNADETLEFNIMLTLDEDISYFDGALVSKCFASTVGNEILIDVYGILEELDTSFTYDDISTIISPNLTGEGQYSFQISEVGLAGGNIYYSPYISTFTPQDGEARSLIFTKLPSALSVVITNGNVDWQVDENYLNHMDKFYIYLYDNENNEIFNRYETADNATRTYNGDNFGGAENEYNISLSCVSNNPFVIGSSERYVLNTANNIAVIVKNQFNSELTLNAGVLSINWDSGTTWAEDDPMRERDIYYLLSGIREGDEVTQSVVTNLLNTTFYYPFTFTLQDLVSGNVRLRFRFTSYADEDNTQISFRRVADIDARYIFSGDLLGVSDEEGLDALAERFSAYAGTGRTEITQFFNILKYSVGGVGSYKNIFDFTFEAIQEGNYKIEYCLLGNSSTLTSEWKELRMGERDKFFVNPTVHVEADFEEVYVDGDLDIVSAYFVKIYRSQIYTQDAGTVDASTYFMQIYNPAQTMAQKYAIEISTLDAGNTWQAKLVGSDTAPFQVEKVDEDNDGEYDYLKLYLNLSVDENGEKTYNAILAQYPDLLAKGDYYFEIFAQGNNYSISSKSSIFALTLYSACQNFAISDGEFYWTAFQNMPTTIVYKASNSLAPEETVAYAQDQSIARFSLENLPAGDYEYIKFAACGSIEGNNINIDSEVYIVENVYKLASPTVSTSLNLFTLQDNNRNVYNNVYSDDRNLKYEVNNNANTENTSFIFTAQTYDGATSVSYYEPGTTNYNPSLEDPDYVYKLTELDADEFSFVTLGSTALYTAERDAEEVNVYNLVLNSQGTSYTVTAVKSNAVTISGKMLPSVPNATISAGNIEWTPITFDDAELGLGNGTIVYEVGVQFYEITNTAQGTTTSNLGTEILAYTTGTTFDLSTVEDAYPEHIGSRIEYVQVTLQAMLLSVSDTLPASQNYVTLVDGRYAYGNQVAYTSLEPTEEDMPYVLRSNGYIMDGMTLADSVTAVEVIDGKLTWQYQTAEEVTFIVTDQDGNVVEGYYNTEDDLTYTFNEYVGEIAPGDTTLNVYVVSNAPNVLKSRKASVETYKLAPVETSEDDGDFTTESVVIEIDGDSISAEVLDFGNYFSNKEEEAILSATGDISFNVTADNARVLILSSQVDYDSINSTLPTIFDGYADVLVVTDQLTVNIVAVGESDMLNSDNFQLSLTRPSADYEIVWDNEREVFTWSSPTQSDDSETIFIVDVNYDYMQNGLRVSEGRRYEITYESGVLPKEFAPTIIGNVRLSLTVKYGNQGLQSQMMTYNNSVAFDLFNSGDGTEENPYAITNAEQFKNMQYRLTKPSYLNTYLLNDAEVTDVSTRFYFSLESDIYNLSFDGVLFEGAFQGVLNGNGHILSYTSNAIQTTNITSQTTNAGLIPRLNTEDDGITYNIGLSLFETVSGYINNLQIIANYTSTSVLTENALFAGLAIANGAEGNITDVTIRGMTSDVAVYNGTERQTVATYAGLVGFNNGRILRGSVAGDIVVSDENTSGVQNIFVGGIAYTSLGNIESATLRGHISLDLQNSGGGQHQVAGIAITSMGMLTIEDNFTSQSASVTVGGVAGNSHIVYLAGIAVYARGSVRCPSTLPELISATEITDLYSSNGIIDTGIGG